MENPHPIRSSATVDGLCTQDMALLHTIEYKHCMSNVPSIYQGGALSVETFTPSKVERDCICFGGAVPPDKVMISHC